MNIATMKPFSVSNVSALLAKSEGRDKAARLVQYLARLILGLTSGTQSCILMKLNERAKSIMIALAAARRVHRWGKEFPVVQSISTALKTPDVVDRVLEVTQKVTLATFMMVDHVGWLKQLKVISHGKRAGSGTIQLGLSYFCYSNICSTLIQLKRLYQLERCSPKHNDDNRHSLYQNIMKHAFLVVQMAHLSRLYETSDATVGFLGVFTSFQDMMAQWPREEKKVRKVETLSANAKVSAVGAWRRSRSAAKLCLQFAL